MKKLVWLAVTVAGFLLILNAQNAKKPVDIATEVDKPGGRKVPKIAIPDFKGSGEAQAFMGTFNQTLWADVSGSGVVDLVPKTMYPLTVPQQPSDFVQPPPPPAENPRGRKPAPPPPPTSGGGRWL